MPEKLYSDKPLVYVEIMQVLPCYIRSEGDLEMPDLSFNEEPRPLPRPYREYRIQPGDRVELRAEVGENNADLLTKIISQMGPGPFEVEQLGTRKHKVKNANGDCGWISQLFLVPEGSSPDD